MKKIISVVLALSLLLAVTACGQKEQNENKNGGSGAGSSAAQQADSKGRVADKYHELLDGENTVYYYEADVVAEFVDDESAEPEESVMAEGQDKTGRHTVATGYSGLEMREIGTKDYNYSVDDTSKEYSKMEIEEIEEMDLTYNETGEMELDGKSWKYDEYLQKYEMEGFSEDGEEAVIDTYLYKKRYLVDEKGELYAIVTLQEEQGEDGAENHLIHREVDTITKFEEGKAPEEFFEIPDDYKEVESLG